MADADDKKRSKAYSKSEAAKQHKLIEPGRVHLSFFDAATLHPLFPDGMEVSFYATDGTVLTKNEPVTRDKNNLYSVALPHISYSEEMEEKEEGAVEFLESPCDIPRPAGVPMVVLRRDEPFVVNCQPYSLLPVGIPQGAGHKEGQYGEPSEPSEASAASETAMVPKSTAAKACAVPVLMARVQEAVTINFHSFDVCFNDYLRDPKALVDHVSVEATPIRTQEHPHEFGSMFQPRTVFAETMDGFAELTGLSPRQLYEIRVRTPKDYICVLSPPTFFFARQSESVEMVSYFQPCGQFPSRSVIFVQQACPGMRVKNLQLTAAGQVLTTDLNGTWNIDPGTTGVIEFQCMGKRFSPPAIDLDQNAPMVFVVEVSDDPGAQLGRASSRRFQFVDERGDPFKFRKLHVKSPTGHEAIVFTDHEGGFEADHGSMAWAEEDETGEALEAVPLLLSEME